MTKLSRGLRWTLIPLAIIAALAAAAPFLVPVSSFLPELTRIASERLGRPVTIAELSFHLLPTPRMVAKGIVVGKKSDAKLGELEIVPDLLSFLTGSRTVRLIRAGPVELEESALSIPSTMPKAQGEPLVVKRIILKDVVLRYSTLRLPVFNLDAHLGEGFAVEEARIETGDSVLRFSVVPQGERSAEIALAGKLYGGAITGNARADWTKLWNVAGKAKLSGVDLVPVQRLLGKKPQLSGRLKSDTVFSVRAKKPEQLGDALSLDGPFEVVGGAYQGVDLTKAADLTGKSVAGDATAFEEMKGKLEIRGKRVRISELCVRSPRVVAGGSVEIAPNQALSGKLDVSIAKTGGFVGVPVALSGTVGDPAIRPTRGYIIGAAVGTLLLPGIGTGIGASAGGALGGGSSCK